MVKESADGWCQSERMARGGDPARAGFAHGKSAPAHQPISTFGYGLRFGNTGYSYRSRRAVRRRVAGMGTRTSDCHMLWSPPSPVGAGAWAAGLRNAFELQPGVERAQPAPTRHGSPGARRRTCVWLMLIRPLPRACAKHERSRRQTHQQLIAHESARGRIRCRCAAAAPYPNKSRDC